MLCLPQIVRLLGTLALAGGIAAASSAQAPAASPSPAKGQVMGSARTPRSSRSSAKTTPAGKSSAAPSANLPMQHRRDPFAPLINKEQTGPSIPAHLPPGKAGLMVSTLRVDGVVRGASGMLVLVSNPQQRVYFLRQGDRLYDGVVEKISMDGVSFREMSKDPFGKPVERVVTKRIYPSAGE